MKEKGMDEMKVKSETEQFDIPQMEYPEDK